MSQHSKSEFKAFVYEDDYCKIQKLVQQYPNIETGGDLFGLWEDERTVVIQLFIGPGKKSVRTTTSFHQDVEYLGRVGSLITTKEGLCNVGEWHSHHQIGMPEPSAADRRTVFNNMPHLGLERFVLFIATIENGKRSQGKTKKRPHDVKPEHVVLRSFLFLGPTHDVLRGEIKIISGENPHQKPAQKRALREIEAGAELPPFEEPSGTLPKTKSKSSGEESVAASVRALQSKKSSNTKEPWKIAQEKPSGPRTLREQARSPKDIEEKNPEELTSQIDQKNVAPEVRRETNPYSKNGAVPQVPKHMDQESLHPGRKPRDDQQYGHRVDHHSKSPDKRNPNQPQATGGLNNENMSPNFDSAPTNRGIRSNASFLGLEQGSQFSNPQRTYTAQERGRGPSTSPPISPLSYRSEAVTHGTQRETQEMLPSSPPASSPSKGFPSDPQPTARTTAGGYDTRRNTDTTSYFKEQMAHRSRNDNAREEQDGAAAGVDKMCAKGFF